jgi:hypothetical protein
VHATHEAQCLQFRWAGWCMARSFVRACETQACRACPPQVKGLKNWQAST